MPFGSQRVGLVLVKHFIRIIFVLEKIFCLCLCVGQVYNTHYLALCMPPLF